MPAGRARDMKEHAGKTEKVPVIFPATLAELIEGFWTSAGNDLENFSHGVRELLRQALDDVEGRPGVPFEVKGVPKTPVNNRASARKEIVMERTLKARIQAFRQKNKGQVSSTSAAICLLCYHQLSSVDKAKARKR